MPKILLVDDEQALTDSLAQILQKEGYQIDVAHNGRSGWELARQYPYDLLILDWMLPQQSGIEICRQLRSPALGDANPINQLTPVLFLTAKDTLDDRVQGLDAGADDYLVKPFELRELLARVRALLRRNTPLEATSPRLRVGNLELDSENQVAYRQGLVIALSEKEVKLLQLLMAQPGQLVTHDQIYHHLWTDQEPPSSNVIAALIRLLRRKIEENNHQPLIHTVYGKGYRLDNEGSTLEQTP
jgi:OmpR-family two-component system manganese-sensing response regulator